MKPEYHVENIKELNYYSNMQDAFNKQTHIECKLSKEDIGSLLQGNAVTLLFLDDNYELSGMIDIKLSEESTVFNVSNTLNNVINNGI